MNPDRLQRAIRFAAEAHAGQKVPGTELPYLLHLSQVASEVSAAGGSELSILCAWLHDTLEDTGTSYEMVAAAFGTAVADGVQALTKNNALPQEARMADSLERIHLQPPDVACVKLADRITNLQRPPAYWSAEKIDAYRAEAGQILAALGDACPTLADRLQTKIDAYPPEV
jgi:(p)ppGpp synthase/HD superfamily hydrolase